ncbi:MBL fold metallo-hydrolase [Bacillus sp. JJ722]|uniref:MBL fold metallo-hydrolase n=1 Tax=Bacillus sp. JJ722 TaxID=3122973 RepID=UPI0030003A96
MNVNDKITKINLPTSFQSEGVNIFLIKGDALTLVDAGHNLEGSWYLFKEQLNSHGYNVKDIKQIIITHHHVDHTGLVKYFDHDVSFMGHVHCERWVNPTFTFLEDHDAFFEDFFHQLSVPDYLANPYLSFKHKHVLLHAQRSLDYHLEEGLEIPGLPEWRVLHTFGHAQGHISLLHPKEGILIGGDILLPNISPNPIIEPPLYSGGNRQKPQILLNETLHKLLELPIERVLPGHGKDITNPKNLIHLRLNSQHARAMKVREWLMEESMSAFDVCRHLFPKSYKSRIGLAMFDTIGQLDYLMSRNLIQEERNTYGSKYLVST